MPEEPPRAPSQQLTPLKEPATGEKSTAPARVEQHDLSAGPTAAGLGRTELPVGRRGWFRRHGAALLNSFGSALVGAVLGALATKSLEAKPRIEVWYGSRGNPAITKRGGIFYADVRPFPGPPTVPELRYFLGPFEIANNGDAPTVTAPIVDVECRPQIHTYRNLEGGRVPFNQEGWRGGPTAGESVFSVRYNKPIAQLRPGDPVMIQGLEVQLEKIEYRCVVTILSGVAPVSQPFILRVVE